MKRLFFCMLSAFVFLKGEQLFSQTAKQTDSANLAGEWYLQPVLPSDTVTGHIPKLSFDLAQKKFKGFTGCNEMNGRFSILANTLSFDKDISVTKIACEGFNEKDFIINLLRVTGYQIKNGILTLQINKTPVSKWVRYTAKVQTVAP